jgi:hypothetical protein
MDVLDRLNEVSLSEDKVRRVRLVDPNRGKLHSSLRSFAARVVAAIEDKTMVRANFRALYAGLLGSHTAEPAALAGCCRSDDNRRPHHADPWFEIRERETCRVGALRVPPSRPVLFAAALALGGSTIAFAGQALRGLSAYLWRAGYSR